MSRTLLFIVNVDWFFLSHRLPIALKALQLGYKVHIATVLTDKLEILQDHGLVVHPLQMDRSSVGLLSTISTFWQICRILKAVQPDLVHLVTIKPVVLGGLAARLLRVPSVVAAVPGLGFVFVAQGIKAIIRRGLVSVLYRLSLGHRNIKVICQNPDDMAYLTRLARLPASKVALIHGSGVDLTEYTATPIPQSVPIVMMAARLLADKGVREFIAAAYLLRQPDMRFKFDVRFVLVGTPDPGNPASLSAQELAALARENLVELWGQRTDMPQVLANAHLVVLPSYREGVPKILLEAAACGRAVITTDVPGCRDAIKSGVTGVLVPARDALALANAIKQLLDDPKRCQAMGQAGRVLAERMFDVRQVVKEHVNIYTELLSRVKRCV